MAKDRSYEATGRKKHSFGSGSRWCKRCGDVAKGTWLKLWSCRWRGDMRHGC